MKATKTLRTFWPWAKWIAPAMFLAGCAPANTDLTIDGVLTPTAGSGFCTYQSSSGPYLSSGLLPAGAQLSGADQLSYVIGLNVRNTLSSSATLDPNGTPLNTSARDDIYVTEVDVSFTVDQGAPVGSLPSETFETGQEVPGAGASPIIFDVIGRTVSEALPKSSNAHPFNIYASIVLKGQTAAQSSVQSDPYVFAINVDYSVPAPGCQAVGAICAGQIQDAFSVQCGDGGSI